MILWLGTGSWPPIVIVAYAAFFPIVINTIAGVKRVDPTLLRAAATMGARRATRSGHRRLPAALPSIGVGLRIGMGMAWTAIIAAELAVGAKAGGGGSGGIGQMMFVFYAYSIELNRIVVCMIAVGIVALAPRPPASRMRFDAAMPWSRAMTQPTRSEDHGLRMSRKEFGADRQRQAVAVDGSHPRHPRGRISCHRRTFGMRQDDGAQHARGAASSPTSGTMTMDGKRHSRPRRRTRRHVPGLRAVSLANRHRQHRLRPATMVRRAWT